ncbi:MAG TPA: NADH-quinone oxidoreductase subunit A [Candidatus Polarisedimenticolia bacterium]|nr:NADH-quinone oxidoreductase subunit A [Candidatus Polarisedimenticolia bacterium]
MPVAGESYGPILVFLIVACIFPVFALVVAAIVRPSRYDRTKMAAYECGVETAGEGRRRYSVHYYVIAVLFVVFDVETVFLFPWAVKYRALGMFGFVEMVLFLAILVLGYLYAWKKGALEWV